MKNKLFIIILCISNFILSDEWINITSSIEKSPNISVEEYDGNNTTLVFDLPGFNTKTVNINNQNFEIISFPTSAANLEYGYPDLPTISKSILVPNNALMNVEVLEQEYVEYKNILIAPSKGNLSRNIDPASVNYFFNDIYLSNNTYPENEVSLREPYILRDFRGQAITFQPFSYDFEQKVLKVYTHMKVRVYEAGIDNRNILRNKTVTAIDKEYNDIYNNHFINFNHQSTRFDYLVDHGGMLIISFGGFIDTMQPLVDWKNKKGIPTEIVDVASIGSSASSIENYVENYYNNNDLTFLLLVGDIAQIPSPSVSGSSSDVSYGCISGGDFYPEVIVGRFSGSNPSQIQTQVERSIDYEKYPQNGVEWYDNALGVASNQGPGFGGYTDDDFNDFLWDTVLSNFTYDNYEAIYDGSGGTASQGISAINDGVSIINYTGHGSISSWGNGAPLSTSQVNSLANNNRLPFVITVGCNVGEFQSTDECFAEAWLRTTNNGEPSGAIAHFGSTISQSWEPPMHGQYGMNLILTESYENQITRSVGGITTNGCMYMNDAQGSSGINETKYWTLFGDPSLNLRTAPPSNMSVSHEDIILIGVTEFVVDTGEDGALVALSKNGELLSSAYSSSAGIAVLALSDDVSGTPGELDLMVTGFNSFPYETQVTVIAPEGAYLVVDDIEVNSGTDGHVDYGDNIQFYLNLTNVGSDPVYGIDISLLSNDLFIDLSSYSESYDVFVGPNGSTQLGPFTFNVDDNVPDQHDILIDCNMSDGQDTWTSALSFTADAPNISMGNISGDLLPGQSAEIEVELTNIGHAPINYPVVIAEGDSFVTVNTSGIANAYYFDYNPENNMEVLYINVSVSSSAPIGYIADFSVLVTNLDGGLYQELSFVLPVGQFTETFENDFSEFLEWGFSGNADWFISEDEQYNGTYSAKSGDINDSQSTSLSVTLDVVMDDEIEFYYKVASEYSPSGLYFYDGLEFYIDNQLQSQLQPTSDGQSPWTYASYPVEAGTRTFTWTYVKDGGGGSTDIEADCSWIDDIRFPPATINYGTLLGDVNGDGQISVLDIVLVVNMVLGEVPVDYVADFNMDGTVDIIDIVLVVNIILGG